MCFMLPYHRQQARPIPCYRSQGHFSSCPTDARFQKGRMTPRASCPLSKSSCILLCKKFWFYFLSLLEYKRLLPYQCLDGHSNTSNQAFVVTPYHPWKRHCRVSQRNQGWLSLMLRPSQLLWPCDPTKILFMSSSSPRPPFPLTSPLFMILSCPSLTLHLSQGFWAQCKGDDIFWPHGCTDRCGLCGVMHHPLRCVVSTRPVYTTWSTPNSWGTGGRFPITVPGLLPLSILEKSTCVCRKSVLLHNAYSRHAKI